MRFTYTEDPTLRAALTQAVAHGSICWDDVAGAGRFDAASASLAVDQTLVEVRNIATSALVTLLDREGVADTWNDAIEQAIQTIEKLR